MDLIASNYAVLGGLYKMDTLRLLDISFLHQDPKIVEVFEFSVFAMLELDQVVFDDIQLEIVFVKFHILGNW